MFSSIPAQRKKLGRPVSNSNRELWEQHRYDVIFKSNLVNFSVQQLVGTGDNPLAEPNPHDLV